MEIHEILHVQVEPCEVLFGRVLCAMCRNNELSVFSMIMCCCDVQTMDENYGMCVLKGWPKMDCFVCQGMN